MRVRSLFAIALAAAMITAVAASQPASVMAISAIQARALNASLSSAPYMPVREDYDDDDEYAMSYLDWEEWYNDEYGSGNDSDSSADWDGDDGDGDGDDDDDLLQRRQADHHLSNLLDHHFSNLKDIYRLPAPRPKPANIQPLAKQYPYWVPTKCFGGTVDDAERKLARAKMAARINRNAKDPRGAAFGGHRVWREFFGHTLYYACACQPADNGEWYAAVADFDRMEEFIVQDCGTQLGRAYNIEKRLKFGVALTVPWWTSRRLCHEKCYNIVGPLKLLDDEFLDRYKKEMVETGPEEGYEYTGHIRVDQQ